MAEGQLGTYVYCVTAGEPSRSLEGLPGVDSGFAVRPIRHGDLTALASPVPLTDFAAEPLKRNLNDLSWLERIARAHQRVLDGALKEATIVPLRLCTVFEDDAGVEAMLDREHDVLARTLARLAGRQEWAVKLIAGPRPEQASGDVPPSGRAYVERLRRDRTARSDAQRAARAAAREVHRALAERAVAARVLRKPARELAGAAGELVLNGGYLVDAGHAAEFRAAVKALGDRHGAGGMSVEISGPWPPYSFVAAHSDER